MNALEIAYDNAITNIKIKLPPSNARVSTASVRTQGEVELGSKLYINGKNVPVSIQGRFGKSIRLSAGLNRLVYRTIAKDGIERYYVRSVYRR